MPPPAETPLLWEQLVTEGHVRAARVRWVRPWLIVIAAVAVAFGLYLQLKVRPSPTSNNGATLMGDVGRAQAPALAAMAGLPALTLKSTDASSVAAISELPRLEQFILDGLNNNHPLSALNIKITQVDADSFWQKPWPKELISTGSEDVKLVGGVFNSAPSSTSSYTYEPNFERWIGVFRKKNNTWQYVSLDGQNFASIPNVSSTSADSIPLTLKPVLPEAK